MSANQTHGVPVFDAHMHIIDPAYPLQENQGFLPESFTVSQYLARMCPYTLVGGAVVSGSFQGFDQEYLKAALSALGSGFVGVTQLPASVSDETLRDLDRHGVRALRFNLKRGGSEDIGALEYMARRVHDLLGWHVELYADAALLEDLVPLLITLPAVSIDHLGLSKAGLPLLRRLMRSGVRVKATGFGRVDFAVADVLPQLYAENPAGLLFGSDHPGTRAPIPYHHGDYELIIEVLGSDGARRVLSENALAWYRLHCVNEHVD